MARNATYKISLRDMLLTFKYMFYYFYDIR